MTAKYTCNNKEITVPSARGLAPQPLQHK